jgi:nitroimidazol reductase NimA-like FMN-containing flavoprotein (pyridoxamine 5'-phosphate oxidase superfamily)
VNETSKGRTEEYGDRGGLIALLTALFAEQRFAVLATQKDGQPCADLVPFAATEDLKQLLFVTPRATRKFANLVSDPQVAMMMDNRQNRISDLHSAEAVTAIGKAEEVVGPEKETLLAPYISKHPLLETFARAPTCALLKTSVEKYDIAGRFQNVAELRMMP